MSSLLDFIPNLPKWMFFPLLAVFIVILVCIGLIALNCPKTEIFSMSFGSDSCVDKPEDKIVSPQPKKIPPAMKNVESNDSGTDNSEDKIVLLQSKKSFGEIRTAMEKAKSSAWMFAINFHKTVEKEPLLKIIIEKGVNFHYLFLNPDIERENLDRTAAFFGNHPQRLENNFCNTLMELKGVYDELKRRGQQGKLKVRLIDKSPGTRMYFFDPPTTDRNVSVTDDTKLFFVPYLYGKDASSSPNFLLRSETTRWYWSVARKIWENSTPWEPEKNMSLCTTRRMKFLTGGRER